MIRLGLFLALCLAFGACDRQDIGPQSQRPTGEEDSLASGLVYILNEGNFGRGNAGISTYDPLLKQARQQAFEAANGGLPLGDVAQSMAAYGGQWYVALNGSSALVALDSVSLVEKTRLRGIGTPAAMALARGKAYLTDVYQNKLRRIDLAKLSLDTVVSLPVPGKNVQALGEKLAVGTSGGIVILDQTSLQKDTLLVTSGPVSSLAVSGKREIWALTDGSPQDSLLGWQGATWQKAGGYGLGKNSGFLRSTTAGDSLYWLQESQVWCVDIANGKPDKCFASPLQTPYGFNLDPYRGELYLCDALDFNQASVIYRMSRSGNLLDSLRTGPISNQLHFARP
jgi:hypothetical protein